MKTTRRNRNTWVSFVLKFLAYTAFIACPVSAVLFKFPLWKEEGGIFATLGVGTLLIGIIVLWTIRNFLADWVQRNLGGFAWSQSRFWVGGTVILLILNTIGSIVADLLTIWLAGCVGLLIGTVLLTIEKKVNKK